MNFVPHASYFTFEIASKNEFWRRVIWESFSKRNWIKVDWTSGSNSSAQQHLLTHPRAKSKCWRFFGFHTDDNGKIAEKKIVHCRLCSITLSYSGNTTNLAYHIWKHHHKHLKDIKESETKWKDDSETSDKRLKHL